VDDRRQDDACLMLLAPPLLEGPLSETFCTFPFVLRDQTLNYAGVVLDGGFRFSPGDSGLYQNGGADIALVTSSPQQFHDNYSATMPSGFSVRHTALTNSTVTAFVFDFPTINVWRELSTTRPFDMARPGAGVTEQFTLRIEIAPTADTTDVQCRRDITYIWARP